MGYILVPCYRTEEDGHGRVRITSGRGIKLINRSKDTIAYGQVDHSEDFVASDIVLMSAETVHNLLESLSEPYKDAVEGQIAMYAGTKHIQIPAQINRAGDIVSIKLFDSTFTYYFSDDKFHQYVESHNQYDWSSVYMSPSLGDNRLRCGQQLSDLCVAISPDNPTITDKNTRKEKTFMNFNTQNLFKDVKFGKAPSSFALSFNNQIAYKGKYFENGALQDSMGLTLDIDGLLYIMPVQQLTKGDIVVKGDDAFYYDGAHYISLTTGLKGDYVPVKIFNMTFYSVVKNLAGNMFGTDAKGGQMNNMLPFLLLGRDNDSDDLIKFMLLSQGGFNLFGQAPTAKKE